MDNLEAALDTFGKGYLPVAMQAGRKVPAEKWKRWETEAMTEASIRDRWEGTRHGLAILCREIVVLDVDDGSRIGEVLENCGLTSAPICRTPRGGYHVHARMRQGVERSRRIRLHGWPVDLLTGTTSLSILPPSTNEEGVPYRWVMEGLPPVSELPLARMGWTREKVRRVVTPEVIDESDRAVRRVRAYLATIEGTVSGQGGCHNRAYRTACVLMHKFALTVQQALPLFREWSNATCEPPWSEAELMHKLLDAEKKRN